MKAGPMPRRGPCRSWQGDCRRLRSFRVRDHPAHGARRRWHPLLRAYRPSSGGWRLPRILAAPGHEQAGPGPLQGGGGQGGQKPLAATVCSGSSSSSGGDEVWFSRVSPPPRHRHGDPDLLRISEFALHVRAILGLPVGTITQYGRAPLPWCCGRPQPGYPLSGGLAGHWPWCPVPSCVSLASRRSPVVVASGWRSPVDRIAREAVEQAKTVAARGRGTGLRHQKQTFICASVHRGEALPLSP